MRPCPKCQGNGSVRFRNPITFIFESIDCDHCLASGKMDRARELDLEYHEEWTKSFIDAFPIKTKKDFND